MNLSEFDYDLPENLIAQTPLEKRDDSKLLLIEKKSGNTQDKIFRDLKDLLTPNDVLVVNKTRVIKARLKGTVNSRPIEIFLHRQKSSDTWECLVYPGKRLNPGREVLFEKNGTKLQATVLEITRTGRIIKFDTFGKDISDVLDVLGETPLPPYIKTPCSDDNRYQTVYNDEQGASLAAPTAGLHFTPELLEKIQEKGIPIEKVLLHVGLGTFTNVETENIQDHTMHSEYISLDHETAKRLNTYKQQGKRIIAVGTTSIRVLESFSDDDGHLGHGSMDTDIFIYPGYKWKFVESLITNFHLPKSTLLMLVSSLAGKENIKNAYRHAIDNNYRFFSFGDAMWVE